MQLSCFAQKITNIRINFCCRNTILPVIESTTFVSPDSRWHHSATGVLAGWHVFRIFVIYRGDWLTMIIDQDLRKRFFSKIVPVFRKYLSVSRWNLPGLFSVSFRFPQVTEFGKSTAIYLADSFCQLYSALWSAWQEFQTIRKSAARWRGRRARGYRKLILRANLLYVPNIKM